MNTQTISPTPASPWLTIPQAADHWQVSADTIRRMVARGELEAQRFGPRALRVSRESLERAGRRVGGVL